MVVIDAYVIMCHTEMTEITDRLKQFMILVVTLLCVSICM